MKTKDRLTLLKEAKTNGTFEQIKEKFEKSFYKKNGEPFGPTNIFGMYAQGAKPGVYVPFSSTYKRDEKTKQKKWLYNIRGGKTFSVVHFGTKEETTQDGEKKTTKSFSIPRRGRVINIEDLQPLQEALIEYTTAEYEEMKQAQDFILSQKK